MNRNQGSAVESVASVCNVISLDFLAMTHHLGPFDTSDYTIPNEVLGIAHASNCNLIL